METPTTIDDLAHMINEGFKTTASKEDIVEVRQAMQAMEGRLTTRLDHLDARVGRIEADVHALRDEMVHKQEFQDALDRITYIEQKLGIESGV
jgi:ribosome assembly protein YihI (activator of Der GTPase)